MKFKPGTIVKDENNNEYMVVNKDPITEGAVCLVSLKNGAYPKGELVRFLEDSLYIVREIGYYKVKWIGGNGDDAWHTLAFWTGNVWHTMNTEKTFTDDDFVEISYKIEL
jgi:hypothetical protein